MTDLHETTDPKYTTQIDTIGWIFVAFAVVITVVAAIVVYQGSGVMIANSPVPHAAGSPEFLRSSRAAASRAAWRCSPRSFAPHLSSSTSPLIDALAHSRNASLGASLIKL